MEATFWHQKWERGEIAFHESCVNSALVEFVERLNLVGGSRFFLPLCGKTLDIQWLLAQGHRVVGAELSPLAIEELFVSLDLAPEMTQVGSLVRYSAANIDIWVGDIFDLSGDMLGDIDAIYDRAALVALPQPIRNRYTQHLIALTKAAPQLLITFEYDQLLVDGPPFSVGEQEVQRHYNSNYQLQRLAHEPVPGGFKNGLEAVNVVWLLQRILP